MEAKWICGDRRLSRAIYPFLQVPPPLLACQATDNSLPLHETAFFSTQEGSLPITALFFGFEISNFSGIERQEQFGSRRKRLSKVFQCFLDDMILFAGIFFVFWGISRIPVACSCREIC